MTGLLPTPTAQQGRNRTSGRNGRPGHDGLTLNDWAWEATGGRRAHRDGEALLPTPSARDHHDAPGMSRWGKNPDGTVRDRTDQLPRRIYALARGERC